APGDRRAGGDGRARRLGHRGPRPDRAAGRPPRPRPRRRRRRSGQSHPPRRHARGIVGRRVDPRRDARGGLRYRPWSTRAWRRRAREVVEIGPAAVPRGPAGRPLVIPLLLSAAFSLVLTLVCTPLFARLFRRIGWG